MSSACAFSSGESCPNTHCFCTLYTDSKSFKQPLLCWVSAAPTEVPVLQSAGTPRGFQLSLLSSIGNCQSSMQCGLINPKQISRAGCAGFLILYPLILLSPTCGIEWGKCLYPNLKQFYPFTLLNVVLSSRQSVLQYTECSQGELYLV